MSDYIRLANVLHTLSCTKQHAERMEELLSRKEADPLCYYYLEETLSPNEERPDHSYWEQQAVRLCEEVSVNPSDMMRLLTGLLDLRRKLDELLGRFPNGARFARCVLLDEPL